MVNICKVFYIFFFGCVALMVNIAVDPQTKT